MARIRKMLLLLLALMLRINAEGLQHRVGDSIWSIPPTNDFYKNWTSSYTFHTGDTLYFDFDSGLYNVIQVSRGDFDACNVYYSYKTFIDGPATVPLLLEGVFYYICNVSNYCALGQKVWIVVEQS